MKCPICAKHVAEERFELHVGRHTEVAPESVDVSADEDLSADEDVSADHEAVATTVPAPRAGAATVRSQPVVAGVDPSALLLSPQGDAMPLPDEEPEVAPDDERADGDATAPVEDAPVDAAPVDAAPVDAAPVDEAPVDDESASPAEHTGGEGPAAVPDDAAPAPDEESAPDVDLLDATAPLAVEPTAEVAVEADAAGWGAPAPAGGHRLAPFPAGPASPRRSTLPLLGLVALVAIAAVIAFALSSDDDDDDKTASVRASATSTTVTFPSLAPSAIPTTAPPAASPTFPTPALTPGSIPPVPPGGGITTPPPGAGGAFSQIQIQAERAVCDENNVLTVSGTAANSSGGRYNVTFSVTVISATGTPLGTARATVAGLNPAERRTFQATGSCYGRLGDGDRPQVHVENVDPA